MKLCCVFNYNPLYRLPIYQKISENFDTDFFFGDSVFEPLKQFEPNSLKGFHSYLKAKKTIKGYIWHSGVAKVLNKKYTHYLLTGDPIMIINWIIILYAKLSGKKLYCWCHGPKEIVQSKKARFLNGAFFKSMDGVFLYNEYNRKFTEDLGVRSDRIHIIHNSLNTPIQTNIYERLRPSDIYVKHFKNSNPVAVFIGRIQQRMKVQYLIETQCILKERGISMNVVLVGPYMDGENIQQLVKEKGLDNQVWFFGPSYDEEITSELLYNADVCVAPGTVGLTAIHSLSYGTPCITHNRFNKLGPEFEAIQNGKTGSFFEEDNVESLADTISSWLNVSTEKRNEVRNMAREEVVKNWSIDSQVDLLKHVF